MITEKKNQHYIPKFYLRNFSFRGNKKQIGVYNIFNEIFIQRSKLKTQGSKNFFYGYDGKIEDGLANIEGHLAEAIRNITNNYTLPPKKSKEHNDLLVFVSLTDLRNPVIIEAMKAMLDGMKSRLLELDPNADTEKLVPQATHDEIIKLSLSNIFEIVETTIDLDYKIFLNKTLNPFITSDYPIVKYNQFLEQKKWAHSKTGYGLVGLQIFIPLNSEIILVLFDSGIYKVGYKKQRVFEITKKEDINKLNILQFINCHGTVFFDEKASEAYIRMLHNKSKKYKRANVNKTELSYIFDEGEQKNLMIFGSSDCETQLKIDGIKIHSKGKSHKLNPSMSQLRSHPEKLSQFKDSNSR